MQQHQARPINQKYAIIEDHLLGKGSTGNVYLGYLIASLQVKVAIKTINLKEVDNQVTRYLLSCQIAALSSLAKYENSTCENVVRLLDVVIQQPFIYLVTELLEGGTLSDYIKRNPNGIIEDEAITIFRQIIEAYRHIQNRGIIHRDLKPDNILFKSKPQINKKISVIDFGYCEAAEVPNKPQIYYNVGSPKYMAPQAYIDNMYSQKSDIWALGVIYYQMLTGKTCDHGMKMQNYLDMIRKNGISLPTHLSAFSRHILSKTLAYNHQSRFNILQIIKQFDNYQSSLHLHHSQALLKQSAQFNDIAPSNDLFLRGRSNNQVFKSAVLSPQNQIKSSNVLNVDAIKGFPMEQRHDGTGQKLFIKSSSARNVNNPIPFSILLPNHISQKLQSSNLKGNHVNLIGAKIRQPNLNITQNKMDVSLPVQKVQFKVLPTKTIDNDDIQKKMNVTHNDPRFGFHREQRFASSNHPDENSLKIAFKSGNLDRRFHAVVQQPMMSIEKATQNRIFHSPERKTFGQATKVQFFTQKKVREGQQQYRHMIQVRPFNGEIRKGVQNAPFFNHSPLFH